MCVWSNISSRFWLDVLAKRTYWSLVKNTKRLDYSREHLNSLLSWVFVVMTAGFKGTFWSRFKAEIFAKKNKTKKAAQVVAHSALHAFIVHCGVCDPLLFLFHTSWLLSPAHLHYITIETRAPSERSPRPFIPPHAIPKQRFITNRTELLRQITHQQRDVSGKAGVHRNRDRAPTPDASAQQSNCEGVCVCCQSHRCTHTSGSKSCVAVPVLVLAAVVYSHIRYDTRALWREKKKRTECMTTN